MPRYSPTFAPFKSLVKQFKSSCDGGLSTSFDSIVARIDKFAKISSSVAEHKGKTPVDTSPLVTELGGDATAVGENTLAKGTLDAKTVDVGLVTYSVATASFTAAASSPLGGAAVASTSSFANVAGADLVFTFNTHEQLPVSAQANTAYSKSTTTVIAIDFEFWDRPQGPLVIEQTKHAVHTTGKIDLSGNIATFRASLESKAPNTLVSLDTQVLTLEDTLSTVASSAVLGASDWF